MVKNLLFATFILGAINANAQKSSTNLQAHPINKKAVSTINVTIPVTRTCATVEYMEQQLQLHPELQQKRQEALQKIQQQVEEIELNNAERSNVVHTIPVVVHVVYANATQNISEAQILSQIATLNQDFRKLNTDFSATMNTAFGNVGADAQIEFCMAQRDPNDQPTNGITRTATTHGAFYTEDDVKTATWGHTPWNVNKYLNLWVAELSNGLLGYAQFPGGAASTDGVVVGYTCFGNIGTASYPYNKGRTATHEIGHWLDLRHIWGDEAACGADDFVTDTPQQKDQNGGCPTFPQTSQAGGSCSGTSPGSMYMNYMDYTDDACMYMFTTGQSTRMNAALNTSRAALLTSNGCVAPGGGNPGAACDTLLNIPVGFTQNLYSVGTGGWGYVSGQNNYGDLAKAEKFTPQNVSYQVSGCYVKFARISYTNTSSSFNLKLYNNSGGVPNNVLTTKNVTYASVAADVVAQSASFIQFTSPVVVANPFYAGVEFSYSGTDTLAIYTTTSGDISAGAGTGYEMWSDNTWHNMNTPTPNGWGLDLSFFIFPVMCDSFVGINDAASDAASLIQVFPNPAKSELNVNISNLKNTTINLYTITGTLIETLNNANSSGLAHFNTSNLAKGIYFVEVKNATFKTTKKVVIE